MIHTVGPRYRNETESAPLLENAYRNSLLLAVENDLKSIAFPAISCGVYAYPLKDAARFSLMACEAARSPLDRIVFVLFGEDVYDAWIDAARELNWNDQST